MKNCLNCASYSNPGGFIGACWKRQVGINLAGQGVFQPVKSRDTCDKWSLRNDARQLHSAA